MKRRRKTSESRILQISNDISEDMCNATKAELIDVVEYWRDRLDEQVQATNAEKDKRLREMLDRLPLWRTIHT